MLFVAGLFGACRSDRAPASGAPPAPGESRAVEYPNPRPKPDFTLTATDGTPFAFHRDTEGYLTLLFFGYTSCPDVCPVHMANLAAALHKLPDRISGAKVVFVTTDRGHAGAASGMARSLTRASSGSRVRRRNRQHATAPAGSTCRREDIGEAGTWSATSRTSSSSPDGLRPTPSRSALRRIGPRAPALVEIGAGS
jgi:protein SCO1/2